MSSLSLLHTPSNVCQTIIFSADADPPAHPLPSPPPLPLTFTSTPHHILSIVCRLAEGVNDNVIAQQLHEKLPNGCSTLPEQVEYVVLRIAKSMLQVWYLVCALQP